MSLLLMQRVHTESCLTGMAKVVASMVAFYADRETDLAWPSNEKLMADWGISERSLQQGLRGAEKAGELRRQPERESGMRPRVYLIEPGYSRQLSMLAAGGATEGASRRAPAAAPALSRERVEGTEGTGEPNPPLGPPAGGAHILPDFDRSPAPSERRSPSRRRRDRRREMRPVAPGPCPLTGLGEREAERLTERWLAIAGRLAQLAGEQNMEIWFPTAHLHPDGVLALAPATSSWVADRFRGAIRQAAGAELAVVACAGVGVAMREEAIAL